RQAKDMLGHAVAAGDDDAVLNRALTVLLDKLGREKLARTDKPRPGRARHRRARRPSAAVRRVVWERDGGRCKYISPDGHRCEETRRIEEHHLDPWALGNDADTPEAFELRCSRHNDYEGRVYFGRRRRKDKEDGQVRERRATYCTRSFSAELVPEQTAISGESASSDGDTGRSKRIASVAAQWRLTDPQLRSGRSNSDAALVVIPGGSLGPVP